MNYKEGRPCQPSVSSSPRINKFTISEQEFKATSLRIHSGYVINLWIQPRNSNFSNSTRSEAEHSGHYDSQEKQHGQIKRQKEAKEPVQEWHSCAIRTLYYGHSHGNSKQNIWKHKDSHIHLSKVWNACSWNIIWISGACIILPSPLAMNQKVLEPCKLNLSVTAHSLHWKPLNIRKSFEVCCLEALAQTKFTDDM